MTTKELLLGAWDLGVAVPLLCVLATAGYVFRFRGRLRPRAVLFGLGVSVFFVALVSPIGVLARGYLFSAHMLQHLLLMLAVPPLVLLGLPRAPAAEQARRWGAAETVGSWLAGVGAMWIWHIQTFCNAAAVSSRVQWLQTVSLVVMGLAFWRPILAPRVSDRLPPLAGIVYLFAACVGCTVLGIIVTLSPVEVCSAYMHPVDSRGIVSLLREDWGLSCRADQELGGLLMWVPACFVYATAVLATLGRYYGEEHAGSHAAAGAE